MCSRWRKPQVHSQDDGPLKSKVLKDHLILLKSLVIAGLFLFRTSRCNNLLKILFFTQGYINLFIASVPMLGN